jgi:hypothetical protein
MTNTLIFRRAFDAAATYIDRLEAHVRRGENPPDLNHCQRLYAHHKLQLHSLPSEGNPEARISELESLIRDFMYAAGHERQDWLDEVGDRARRLMATTLTPR